MWGRGLFQTLMKRLLRMKDVPCKMILSSRFLFVFNFQLSIAIVFILVCDWLTPCLRLHLHSIFRATLIQRYLFFFFFYDEWVVGDTHIEKISISCFCSFVIVETILSEGLYSSVSSTRSLNSWRSCIDPRFRNLFSRELQLILKKSITKRDTSA